jgi:UDP-glucose 4-epimerase
MKVAVTGGRGRLAPLVTNAFRGSGAEVSVYSREAGNGLLGLDDFVAPDVLVHCAWSSVPLTAEQHPGLTEEQDLPLLTTLIEKTRATGTLIIFPSTGAIYGNTGEIPATENHPPKPIGAYARGKLCAEKLLLDLVPDRSLILRTTNLLGEANDPNKQQGVLPKLVAAARSGTEFFLWGDGMATKDYIHISDFLQALQLLIRTSKRGIFNVGSGISSSLMEMISIVEAITGHQVKIKMLPHFDWDVSCSRIAVEKLKAVGWEPEVNLHEAIGRCLT